MRLDEWTGQPPWTGGAPLDLRGTGGRVPIGPGDADTDADGRPDTLVLAVDEGLSLFTDLDGDGLADQELRLGGGPAAADDGPERTWWGALDELLGDLLAR